MPGRIQVTIYTTFTMVIAIFALIMFSVVGNSVSRDIPGCDYCIVFGERVYDDGISTTLKKRLDRALAYEEEKPGTVLVLTGGMNSSDPVPEALAMYNYLSMKGVPDEMMVLEPRARSISESVAYSMTAIDNDLTYRMIPPPIVIGAVTSDYNMFRTIAAAGKIYTERIYAIPADSDPVMFPHMCVTECCAVLRDFLLGKI